MRLFNWLYFSIKRNLVYYPFNPIRERRESMKLKKYTIEELKQKYWEYRKKIMTKWVSQGYAGGGGSYTEINYADKVEDFIIWLEEI
jgi:hypothetical protein